MLTLAGNIGDPAYSKELVQRTVDEFGALNVLVNNATYQNTFKELADVTPEELERHYRTNVCSIFYLCQAALPHLKPGASIINTSSVQAYQPRRASWPTRLPRAQWSR